MGCGFCSVGVAFFEMVFALATYLIVAATAVLFALLRFLLDYLSKK